MAEEQLIRECEGFFRSNGYEHLEHDRMFDEGTQVFNSLLVGTRGDGEEKESVATYFRPRLDKHDISLSGMLESMLYDITDNYENTSLMLVTDSLSYLPITKTEELGVTIENLMEEGMFVLSLNGRSGYALFEDFEKLTMPIPVQD
jgi:hypothetical protein